MSITLLAIIHFTLLFHGTTLLILNLCTKQRGVVEGVRESDEEDLSRQSATGSKSKDVAKVKPTRKKASLDKKAPAEKKASSEKKASTEKKAPVMKKAASEKKASTENKPKPSPKPSPKSSQIKLLTKPQADKGVKKSIMGMLKNLSPETRKPPKKEPSKEKASSEKKPSPKALKSSAENISSKKGSVELPKKDKKASVMAKVRLSKSPEAKKPEKSKEPVKAHSLQPTQDFEHDKVLGGGAYYPDEGQDDTIKDAPSFENISSPPSI